MDNANDTAHDERMEDLELELLVGELLFVPLTLAVNCFFLLEYELTEPRILHMIYIGKEFCYPRFTRYP